MLSSYSSSAQIYSEVSGDEDEKQIHHVPDKRYKTLNCLLVILITVSLVIIGLLSFLLYRSSQVHQHARSHSDETTTSGVPQSGIGIMHYQYFNEGYDDEDFIKGDPFWASDYPVGNGVVYLSQHEIQRLGLHHSAVSPFRPGNVSAYESSAYHSLHCLSELRYSLWQFKTTEFETKDPSGSSIVDHHRWKHVRHCLSDLRQYILCNFDENLLYMEDPWYHPGGNQPKTCKTVDTINQWLEQNYIFKESD